MSDIDKDIQKRVKRIMGKYFDEPVYSKNKFIESCYLFIWKYIYKITGIPYRIRLFLQRLILGYNDLDKWNAYIFIAKQSVLVLRAWRRGKIMGTATKRHREDRFNNIIELTQDEIYAGSEEVGWEGPDFFTMDEWKAIIDDIIFAFQWSLNFDRPDGTVNEEEYREGYKRQKRGLKLFSIYFNNLWD